MNVAGATTSVTSSSSAAHMSRLLPRVHGYRARRYRIVAAIVTRSVTDEPRRRGRLLWWSRAQCYPPTRAQGVTMARLTLQLLGGFRARLEPGGALRLPTRKAEALLAYLALPLGQRHPRDKLASLLWGDLPAGQARASLRQAIFRVRRAIGDPDGTCLRLDAEGVALEPAAVVVDVTSFEQAVADAAPEALAQAAA